MTFRQVNKGKRLKDIINIEVGIKLTEKMPEEKGEKEEKLLLTLVAAQTLMS